MLLEALQGIVGLIAVAVDLFSFAAHSCIAWLWSVFTFGAASARPARVPPSRADSFVLVTGCSSGIGEHAAVTLAHAGFTVLAGVRTSTDAAAIEAKHRGIRAVILDVSSDSSVQSALQTVKTALTSSNNSPSGKSYVLSRFEENPHL